MYLNIITCVFVTHYIIALTIKLHDVVARDIIHAPWFIKQTTTTNIHNNETVGFHNFNLRIFNLRVSNPNKLIVDVFLTRCRISMCQGLGPTKTRLNFGNRPNKKPGPEETHCYYVNLLYSILHYNIVIILSL